MISQKALEAAKSQIGVRESGGANSGLEIQKYLESVGYDAPDLWCMAFVYWCLKQASGTEPVKLTRHPGVGHVWNNTPASAKILAADARNTPTILRPGHIFIHISPAGGHTGFVLQGGNPIYSTVEGNTNQDADPSRDGDGVYQLHHRRLDDSRLKGFIDLDKL